MRCSVRNRRGPNDPGGPPSASVTADATSGLVDVAFAVHRFEATAEASGTSVIRFAGTDDLGSVVDTVTLQVAAAASVRFTDPVRQGLLSFCVECGPDVESGFYGPDATSPILITPGTQLALQRQVPDGSGQWLGT